MQRSCLLFPVFCAVFATFAGQVRAENVTGAAVIREMNFARQNPAGSTDQSLVLSEQRRVRSCQGLSSLKEAIHFLKKTAPLQPLILSAGLCRGAADHCNEQAGGAIGHGDPGSRISRYGQWGVSWGENI